MDNSTPFIGADLAQMVEKVNDLMDTNEITGHVTIKYTEYLEQADTEAEILEFEDRKFTIWIENTTGDEGKYSEDAGGWVSIVGEAEHNVASSFNKKNLDKRKTVACTQGRADKENGWKVDVARTAIGPMGTKGKSGAKYFLKDYMVDDTHFLIELEDGVIKGTVVYDEANETIKICVEVDEEGVILDRDIDVAVAFKRITVAPDTGDNYNLGLYVATAVMSLAACMFILKKSKVRS